MKALGRYYGLVKPGIIYGNLITAAAGFFVASPGAVNTVAFVWMMAGIALVMACGCALNNVLDRGIDATMARTRFRPLVTGEITVRSARIFAAALGTAGTAALYFRGGPLPVAAALAGLVLYVPVYGYWKRRSPFGTQVGAVAGAVPPLVGYLAARGRFDLGAFLTFAVFALWQMPHFYGIALYRLQEYRAAGIPVLPAVRGGAATRRAAVGYLLAFAAAAAAFTAAGITGYTYLLAVLLLSGIWLRAGAGSWKQPDQRWGRGMFRFSLLAVMVLSVMMAAGPRLP